MRRLALSIVPVLALAACNHKASEETQTTTTRDGVTTTTITTREVDNDHGWGHHRDHDDNRAGVTSTAIATSGSGVDIDTDGFKGNVQLPGVSFAGDHLNMDGLTLYPGSTVKGMHVHAVDKGGSERGEVTMNFMSPAAPLTVAQHMADAARTAGFTLRTNTAAEVSGSKTDGGDANRFTVTLIPSGATTAGQMTITGAKS